MSKENSLLKKIRPLADRLVVQAINEDMITASGIVLPDTVSKEKPQKGKVVAVGNGRVTEDGKKIPMEVKVGDTVLFTKYGPTEIKVDGEEIMILNESDVLAIVE